MAPLPRAECPVCHGDVALRKGGELREHPDHRHELYGTGRGEEVPKCPGSGLAPAEADGAVFESSGVAPQGKLMSKEQFVELLGTLIGSIEADDSMEGSLAYEWGERPGSYRVQAALCHGNSMGQGAIRLVRADL